MMWIHIGKCPFISHPSTPKNLLILRSPDHCLEDLRQAVICNPDLSIYTYDWIPSQRKPWPNFVIDSECVNWEMLDGWAGGKGILAFRSEKLGASYFWYVISKPCS